MARIIKIKEHPIVVQCDFSVQYTVYRTSYYCTVYRTSY